MAYIEEKFNTRLERNQRKDELNKTHRDVVIYSNPVKIGFDERTFESIYETEWIVAYPPQIIESVEQLTEILHGEQECEVAVGVPEVLPPTS
jgi:hypothetical protein